jgi:sugar fermentation stimulation protein A
MKFEPPLIQGKLVKRYKRFMADVELEDGSVVTAHCANSGSMLSVNEPGADVWISPATNPDRKLKFTWEMLRIGEAMVGVNTNRPNKLVAEAILDGTITELSGYATLRHEVKYGKNSRIDLLLEDDARPTCYVEVKNVTMRRDLSPGAPADFPDSVTTRGTKHLHELSDMVADGHRAAMMYLVQRDDAAGFEVASDIDPDYAAALTAAVKAGVEVICYDCKLDTHEITVNKPLAIKLP